MNFIRLTLILAWISLSALAQDYPTSTLKNDQVKMKIYTPDPERGFYRSTRFDWSGMIYSLEYKGHQYFGQHHPTHDPLFTGAVTGPVDGYITPGLGYDEALPGGEFIRIGVGVLEKPDETDYQRFEKYKILHTGVWDMSLADDWILFTHTINSINGWGYIYTKRIELLKDTPGFRINYSLQNTGIHSIETDQFNHNFFIIDNTAVGSAFRIRFPFEIYPDRTEQNRTHNIVRYEGNELILTEDLVDRTVWIALKGYGTDAVDNQFEILNKKTGAGVRLQGSLPLGKLVFWANPVTLCPENFIVLSVPPGGKKEWSSVYTFFIEKE